MTGGTRPTVGLRDVTLRDGLQTESTVATADKMLQEARAALATEDYATVTKALNGAAAQLQAALKQIEAAVVPASPRRKR